MYRCAIVDMPCRTAGCIEMPAGDSCAPRACRSSGLHTAHGETVQLSIDDVALPELLALHETQRLMNMVDVRPLVF